ncbi:hypothetical protein FRC17_000978, partial [Serendipita sp. 399]
KRDQDEDNEEEGLDNKIVKRARLVSQKTTKPGEPIALQIAHRSISSSGNPEKWDGSRSNAYYPPGTCFPSSKETEEGNVMGKKVAALNQLLIRANDALHRYRECVEAKGEEEEQQKACQEMAAAWERWSDNLGQPISPVELEQFGKSLDPRGRRALTTALQVEDWILDKRVEDRLHAWIGEVKQPRIRETAGNAHVAEQLRSELVSCKEGGAVPTAELSGPATATIACSSTDAGPSGPCTQPSVPHSAILVDVNASPTFSKTPEGRIGKGKLPAWASGLLYTTSHEDLRRWMEDRREFLVDNSDYMTPEEKEAIRTSLLGPWSNLTLLERGTSPMTRTFNSLKEEQRPILLDGIDTITAYCGKKDDFAIVCRMSFSIGDDGSLQFADAPCGEVIKTRDSMVLHARRMHLSNKQYDALKKRAGMHVADDNTATVAGSDAHQQNQSE